MLSKIIAFSIKNKLIIGLFTIALIIYGSLQLYKLPFDAVPDITDNQVQIITITPALGASDVERLITFPIEQATSNIPGLKKIRSFSRFGLSLITVVFDDNVDIYWARQQVTERLKVASEQIPKGIGSPELAPVTTGLGEIYQYTLKAKKGYESKYTTIELRTIQDWIVRRQLLGIKGVADISSFGGKLKQYEVAIYPEKLSAFHINIGDVYNALEKNNENTGGAYIEKENTVLYIRTQGLIKSFDDINNIVIKQNQSGVPLLIKDIADVKIGSAIRYGALTYNNEGEVAGGIVMMLKGSNSSKVIADVKLKVEQIKKTLPPGVELEPYLDRSKMVKGALHTVTKNLCEGALIVIFVLVLFLGNIRAGLIVASIIPLSLLFAVILMNWFGVSGNLMSLGALDFGLIVDGAVIIVEATLHRLYSNKLMLNRDEIDREVGESATKMTSSAVFGQIIILIVYLPIFTLEGIEGKMFIPMAQTVAFALLGAFILSITFIPMISSMLLGKKPMNKKGISERIMHHLITMQQRYLRAALMRSKLIIWACISIFAGACLIFSQMGGEFLPEIPEGDFAIETRVLPGSNLKTSTEANLKAAHLLKSTYPEIEKVIGKTGSGEIPTDPMPMESSDLMVILKDKSDWTSASSWHELKEKFSKTLAEIPGVNFSIQYPVAMRFNELMTGAKQDVVCKIYGENLDTLSKYSKLLGDITSVINGATDIYIEPIDGLPQLVINYNRNEIAHYGLNIEEVNRVINTSFAGHSAGLVFEDEKRFDLVVRLAGDAKQNIDQIRNLLISTPYGTQIPLYHIADVGIKESINQIQREDAKRRIIVGFNIKDRDVESVVEDLQTAVVKNLTLPSGYYISYGGAFENLQAASNRLVIAVPFALILIYLLLYFAFNSFKQALLIYSAIPLSAIGGILFLLLRGMPFSISAGIGFIALFGVAVLNGLVLIAEFNRLKQDGLNDTVEIVLQGTKARLRPVLMTALVASLGFLPMALSHGSGAEVQRPLATVVIGGLLVSTLLTLIVLPLLYILFEKWSSKRLSTKSLLVLLPLILLSFNSANAQKSISLEAAIDSGLQNNLGLKVEQLNSLYHAKLKSAAIELPNLNINGEYGQLNSAYKDNKIGFNQGFNSPVEYYQSWKLHDLYYQKSLLGVVLKECELQKIISEVYYQLIYLSKRCTLLKHCDSIYQELLVRENLKLQKGESNILAKANVEIQEGKIAIQLKNLESDIKGMQVRLSTLMGSNANYTAIIDLPDLVFIEPIDTNNNKELVYAQFIQQDVKIAERFRKNEQAKLLPTFNLGFSSMTIQGIGNDEKYYSKLNRFNSLQLGLSLPVFYSSQRAKISAARHLEQISLLNAKASLRNFNSELSVLRDRYNNQLNQIAYYKLSGLKNAELISATANQLFKSGDISYLEWTTLTNNALDIHNSYLEASLELNLIAIQLNYLTQKLK